MSWRDYLSDLMLRPPTAARLQQEELYQTERELAQEASLVEEYGFLLQRSQARLEMLRLRHQRLTEAELARRTEAGVGPFVADRPHDADVDGTHEHVGLTPDQLAYLAKAQRDALNVYGASYNYAGAANVARGLAGEATHVPPTQR